MNYIYDILINFQTFFIDIFDWNLDDYILHIRKIPLFKVSSKTILDIVKNRVKIDQKVLNKIYNKTETFTNKKIDLIDYACLLSDGKEVIAIKINKRGVVINKSKLLIDEAEEVIDYCEALAVVEFEYDIINKEYINHFKTRNELKINNYITKEINKDLNDNNLSKLSYLYFECFGVKCVDIKKIVFEITNYLDQHFQEGYLKIYSFFKMTTNK